VTCTVTAYVPELVGVPEIVPVVVVRLVPGGIKPESIDQV